MNKNETPETDDEAFVATYDYWETVDVVRVSFAERLERERNQYREALDRIARPIWWMQEDAKRDGCTINGAMAANLADSDNYLRGIAEKALSQQNVQTNNQKLDTPSA